MKHPLTNNYKLLLYYSLFWGIIATINIILQVLWYNVPITYSLLDSGSNYILYPLLGSSIWYSIRYNSLEEVSVGRLILFHFIAASILCGIWVYISYAIYQPFIYDDNKFLKDGLPSKIFVGYVMYIIYLVFFYAVNYYQSLKEKIKKEVEYKALIREAELQALKSQINPHFLFNSLNSISSLTVSDPERAQEMVINLSNFMRYSLMHNEKEMVSFSRELDNIKLYLSIEKVRFGKKLNAEFEIDAHCMEAEIPNMILQPLFENAIKYGVYETTEQVTIKTSCECDGNALKISIVNDYDASTIKRRGEGIGLRNIRKRMEIIYNQPDLIKITDHKTSFEVQLVIPQKQAVS
ncbi:MAG: histidine kinase [Prolixibacteraceae bacterium]|jgi:two-component system LytT family sensor kinase|nr:histidine kinase [Prolixibacteraceae bacterium]